MMHYLTTYPKCKLLNSTHSYYIMCRIHVKQQTKTIIDLRLAATLNGQLVSERL